MVGFGSRALEHIARKRAGMVMLMKNLAGQAEAEMKEEAPWTDRTSNARNGLTADVNLPGTQKDTLSLAHGVDYGVYLELANAGKFSIVNPKADEYAQLLSAVVKAWWYK